MIWQSSTNGGCFEVAQLDETQWLNLSWDVIHDPQMRKADIYIVTLELFDGSPVNLAFNPCRLPLQRVRKYRSGHTEQEATTNFRTLREQMRADPLAFLVEAVL